MFVLAHLHNRIMDYATLRYHARKVYTPEEDGPSVIAWMVAFVVFMSIRSVIRNWSKVKLRLINWLVRMGRRFVFKKSLFESNIEMTSFEPMVTPRKVELSKAVHFIESSLDDNENEVNLHK